MLPLMVNLTGRRGMVVGGGAVGRRKADALLSAGARVRLVCLEPRPEDAGALEWLAEPYHAGHLVDAVLVFAAATPIVNRQVVADARAHGVWVNSASEPEAGDFHLPAIVRRGELVIAVSTGGTAPGLAGEVRRRLEEQFDDSWGQWIALLAEMRPLLQAQIPDAATRHVWWQQFCQERWRERLRQEGVESVRAAMHDRLCSLATDSSRSI